MDKILSEKLNFVAYCGLYCPKCHRMKISSSAKKLLNELENAENNNVKFFQKFSDIKPNLEKLIILECKKFCRDGGGKSAICPIKECCKQHNIIGCWECPDFNSCKKLKPQFLKNNIKLRKLNIEEYIEQYK